ncbi:5'-nucleotidase C-terminal domain-containing protein [Hydrogenophaga pseudoflava]|uniref:5'-nucleotidase C-terminal domain-containing protein n=1 Tax=Hydrogenophaga pseudoflava TaxID=47421 RepID=UPI0027E4D2D6|nr:5'-nucleotidase C-terminal domain-containing protein [Hydrogenophaga pseudoflava]MDQ7743975.1 5'-nucleotidase C-terminal domain-containing protein [Hydrogenophaga pseudoflava]
MNAHPFRRSLIALCAGLSLNLSACGGGEADTTPRAAQPRFPAIDLTLAHINDHHSQLDPFVDTELLIDGVATRVELGGFPRVTAAFRAHEKRKDVIRLHAGDAITGSLYHTLFKGEADAALMNTVCFDAFALGNHEFDDSDAGLKVFLDHLRSGECQTPVLAANVQPAVGTPLAPKTVNDYIQPFTIKTIQGVKVAIIGIDIKGKTTNSSRPLATTVFEDEVTAAQRSIDALKKRGLRHFVLLTHQGYEADRAMAAQLTDVDAIVGGDSHTLLGDFQPFGLASSGAYPTIATNKEGKKVCIGQAWEYSKAIGELKLSFNRSGEVSACGGQASLLIGSGFKRRDAAGAWVAVDETTRTRLLERLKGSVLKVTEPDAVAATVLAGYSSQVQARKAEIIGSASEALCLVRVPGESTNRSGGVAGCESANTLARGSDAAQVVADAFLAGSLAADVAVQNAGGVRIAIPAGPLSMNTAFTLLPFTNVLVELRLTGQQLVAALEDAVSNHLDAAQSSGSHPYAAGLRWDLDMSLPRGSRFGNVQVRHRTTGAWGPIEPMRLYTVVTNDFIASGRDGYATFGAVFATGAYVNNYLLYTQTFVDHVRMLGTVTRPAAADYSHQSVTTAAGLRLP